jgi:hypothetical protein
MNSSQIYKGYIHTHTKLWNVIIDNYFHMELVEEPSDTGIWTGEREDGRYFSEYPIQGWERWRVTNCSKIRG